MKNRMLKPGFQMAPEQIQLKSIWEVEADSRYVTTRAAAGEQDFVLVRTYGGAGALRLWDGRQLRLSAGTLMLLKNRSIWRYQTEKEEWIFDWFVFNGNPGLPQCQILSMDGSQLEEELLLACKRAAEKEGKNAQFYFQTLLCFYRERWGVEAERGTHVLEQALEMLLEPMGCSIKKAAETVGISDRTLRTLFHKQFGASPKRYLEKKRLDAAHELLKTTSDPVGEIAYYCGYQSPYYFSKVFKKEFGMAPSFVRKR